MKFFNGLMVDFYEPFCLHWSSPSRMLIVDVSALVRYSRFCAFASKMVYGRRCILVVETKATTNNSGPMVSN